MDPVDGRNSRIDSEFGCHVRPEPPHTVREGDLVKFRALVDGYHALVAAAVKAHEHGLPSFFSYARSVEVYEDRLANRTALDEVR